MYVIFYDNPFNLQCFLVSHAHTPFKSELQVHKYL